MKKIVVIITLGLLLVLFLLIGRKSPEALTPVAKEDAPPTADVIRLNAREIDEPKSSPLPNEADLPATDPSPRHGGSLAIPGAATSLGGSRAARDAQV